MPLTVGTAGHIDHGVAGAKPERLHGEAPLGALRVAGHRVQAGDDVVVLGLLAIGRDQMLLRTVELAHGVLLERMPFRRDSPVGVRPRLGAGDSTATLIAAISTSITR